jgi:hypothetical protein
VGAEKAFTKWLPRLFPTPLQWQKCMVAQGGDLEKMTLKLYILFLINKAIPGIL